MSTKTWWVVASGMLEPVLLFASVGIAVASSSPTAGSISQLPPHQNYLTFVYCGLVAVGVMNGAIYESTLNFFYRYHHLRIYEVVLTSPLTAPGAVAGEALTAAVRGTLYGAVYGVGGLLIGLIDPAQLGKLVLWLPVGSLGFAGLGVWLSSVMRSWNDLELVNLVMLPMVMLSCIFFPLSVYPVAVAGIVSWLPLSSLATCLRDAVEGSTSPSAAVAVVTFALFGTLGLLAVVARSQRLLLRS